MNFRLADSPQLSTPPSPQHALVPAGYAEKAMSSLMQLHTELMDEKEKRVELFRTLMEKDQALAELRMYVRMLEEKLAAPIPPPSATPPPPVVHAAPVVHEPVVPTAPLPPPRRAPVKPAIAKAPVKPVVAAAPRQVTNDGWKSW